MIPDRLPLLDTNRLSLRELRHDDVADLYRIFSNPEVMRYWSRPVMTDKQEAHEMLREIIAGARERKFLQWGVALKETDQVIGTCTLFAIDESHKRTEIGYVIGREHWHQGFAREIVPRVIDFAFDELGLHRIEADVDPRNTVSIRIVERLGFQREGLLRERYHVNGEIQDSALFGLLKPNWTGK